MQHKHEEEPTGDVARWKPPFHLHTYMCYISPTLSAHLLHVQRLDTAMIHDLQSAHPSDRLVIEEVFIGEAAPGSLEDFVQ